MKEIKIIIAGVGSRGMCYARECNEIAGVKVVGMADPRHEYRDPIERECQVSKENLFDDWREMVKRGKFADAVVISTQDNMHVEPVIAFAEKGYDILLEKPMAPTFAECCTIFEAVKRNNVNLAVCHVLRYTNYTRKLKEIIESGAIGEIVSISHLEPVNYWHQAHSFVRGNWGNTEKSSPMLLAKSCHDLDWIRYVMNKPCERVSSFGSLFHFKKEQQPTGAADRCLDCPDTVEEKCPYSAKRFYFDRLHKGNLDWPLNILSAVPDKKSITDALRSEPYGRCVYACDNNVVDHQVVNMEFEGGRTASFTMTAFAGKSGRETIIFGTKGQIIGDSSKIKIIDFLTSKTEEIDTNAGCGDITDGHSGGDAGLVKNFIEVLQSGDTNQILTGPEVSLESHLMVFAAEIARLENRVVEMSELINNALRKIY